ncbi:MAG: hypothetical protein ACHQ1D_03720, partial [Nitrososphaerales archaeon]
MLEYRDLFNSIDNQGNGIRFYWAQSKSDPKICENIIADIHEKMISEYKDFVLSNPLQGGEKLNYLKHLAEVKKLPQAIEALQAILNEHKNIIISGKKEDKQKSYAVLDKFVENKLPGAQEILNECCETEARRLARVLYKNLDDNLAYLERLKARNNKTAADCLRRYYQEVSEKLLLEACKSHDPTIIAQLKILAYVYPAAQVSLGRYYLYLHTSSLFGNKSKLNEAEELLLNSAARHGESAGYYFYGEIYREIHKDPVTALKYYFLAASLGNSDALSKLKIYSAQVDNVSHSCLASIYQAIRTMRPGNSSDCYNNDYLEDAIKSKDAFIQFAINLANDEQISLEMRYKLLQVSHVKLTDQKSLEKLQSLMHANTEDALKKLTENIYMDGWKNFQKYLNQMSDWIEPPLFIDHLLAITDDHNIDITRRGVMLNFALTLTNRYANLTNQSVELRNRLLHISEEDQAKIAWLFTTYFSQPSAPPEADSQTQFAPSAPPAEGENIMVASSSSQNTTNPTGIDEHE